MIARTCRSCGAPHMKRFKNETFSIQHDGLSETIQGLNGWRCGECGEVEFDRASARKYASAGDRLVLRAREIERSEIRRIRRKLGLTQAAAGRLTGGGHNAFSRYERGEAVPLPAVVNLFKLLDKHPNLLKDLLAS